ncbi:MAG: formylglycine-generating enzyme family protein, partial [Planctomycetota bacterium]
ERAKAAGQKSGSKGSPTLVYGAIAGVIVLVAIIGVVAATLGGGEKESQPEPDAAETEDAGVEKEVRGLLEEARKLEQGGDLEKALSILAKLDTLRPGLPEAESLRERIRRAQRKGEEASRAKAYAALWRKAQDLEGKASGTTDPEAWAKVVEAADAARANRATDEVKVLIGRARSMRDLSLALASEKAGDMEKAVEYATRAGTHGAPVDGLDEYIEKLQGRLDEGRLQVGKRRKFKHFADQARAEEEKGEAGDPETALAFWERAAEFAASEEERGQVQARIRALGAELRYREAMARGRAAEKEGDREEARKAYTEALKAKEKDKKAREALERLAGETAPPPVEPKSRQKRFREAVTAAGKKERMNSGAAQFEALALWRKAFELADDATDRRLVERAIRMLVAKILRREMTAGRKAEAKGDWIAAISAYERALVARPDEYYARKALDRAKGRLASVAKALGDRFIIPPGTETRDAHGNPIVEREDSRMDPVSGWPYEIWLKQPRAALVLVPAGSFDIGSPASEEGRYVEEGPVTRIRIEKPFYIGKYEWTQEGWEAVWGENPSLFSGASRPVDNVAWKDVKAFLEKLNADSRSPLRLPSEAEWEYAARAGTSTRFHSGDADATLDAVAWFAKNAGETTHPVGRKKPNGWGLYDMHGNLWEWCEDVRHNSYDGIPKDGTARRDGDGQGSRVLRGGSYNYPARECRVARRNSDREDRRVSAMGFRVAFTPKR